MDGTLVDSTDGVVGAWELFAEKYPGLDVTRVLSCKSKAFRSHIVETEGLYALSQLRMASVRWRT